MAKRFTDTDLFKKRFLRGLEGAYKLLWIYIYHDCNHAGIWEVDFEIASIRIGLKVDEKKAVKAFEDKIQIIDGGEKWFIPSFIEFQYGELKEINRAHNSVLQILKKYENKGLTRPLQGRKDKDMVKDKDKDKDKRKADFLKLVEEAGAEYTAETRKQFYEYWTEHGPKDKKMRFEKEKSWDMKKRLARWARTDYNKTEQKGKTNPDEQDTSEKF